MTSYHLERTWAGLKLVGKLKTSTTISICLATIDVIYFHNVVKFKWQTGSAETYTKVEFLAHLRNIDVHLINFRPQSNYKCGGIFLEKITFLEKLIHGTGLSTKPHTRTAG